VPISSTKTNHFGSTSLVTVTLQAALSHSPRSTAPTVRFLAEAKLLEQPPYGRVTEGDAGDARQEAASFGDGGRRALFHVLFEQLLRRLVGLRRPSTTLSRLEGLSSAGNAHVTLNRGEAYAEKASGSGLGHASSNGSDDRRAQIFGVGLHALHNVRICRLDQRL
jgi:hypothetical protein